MTDQPTTDLQLMDLSNHPIRFLCILSIAIATLLPPIHATPIRTVANGGLESYTALSNITGDDVSPLRSLGFTINYFGANSTTTLRVNSNGTLNSDFFTDFSPVDLTTSNPLTHTLAPYWTDWDPSNGPPLKTGTATINGKNAFIAHWDGVKEYGEGTGTGNVQAIIIDRADTGAGNFDVEYNYESMTIDRQVFIGYANTSGTNTWKLPGSMADDKFKNTDHTPIKNVRKVGESFSGRITLESRNGVISEPSVTWLPQTITLNITADNTASNYNLSGHPLVDTTLAITQSHAPVNGSTFTNSLSGRSGGGQFTDITLSPLNNGLGWDLSELYTQGTFKVTRSPDRLTLFKPYVWLDATDAGTLISENGTIKQWIDKSGNNRHAYQTNENLRPQQINNQINGKPILRFDGTKYMNFQSQLFTGTTARTIVAILKKATGITDTMSIYTDGDSTQIFDLRSDRLQYEVGGENIPFTTDLLSNTQYRVIIATIGANEDIGQIQVFEKGIPRNTLTQGTAMNTATSGVSGIGRNSQSTDLLIGDIAELLLYDRKLTPWEIDNLTRYYTEKYKTSPTPRTYPSVF